MGLGADVSCTVIQANRHRAGRNRGYLRPR